MAEYNDATPAEIIEIVGNTGMHGEAKQVKCRVLEGSNKGRIITEIVWAPVQIGDILMLRETAHEAKKL